MATTALVVAAFFQLSLRTPERDWGWRGSALEVLRDRPALQGCSRRLQSRDGAENTRVPWRKANPTKLTYRNLNLGEERGFILKPCIFPWEVNSSRGLILFTSGHFLLLACYALGYFYAVI